MNNSSECAAYPRRADAELKRGRRSLGDEVARSYRYAVAPWPPLDDNRQRRFHGLRRALFLGLIRSVLLVMAVKRLVAVI